ncbi:hypothetical protein BDN67DRAFT_913098, partial [Paxillus ammoniavirescens]
MPEGRPETTQRLRILQQNLNGSDRAQHSLLNGPGTTQWDILALQEPHINNMMNTASTGSFRAVYTTGRYTNPTVRPCTVTMICTSLDTNHWAQIPFPSSDVVIVQLTGLFRRCTIFNIYNEGDSQRTL